MTLCIGGTTIGGSARRQWERHLDAAAGATPAPFFIHLSRLSSSCGMRTNGRSVRWIATPGDAAGVTTCNTVSRAGEALKASQTSGIWAASQRLGSEVIAASG